MCGAQRVSAARGAPSVGAVIGVSGHVLAAHEGFFSASTAQHVIRPPLIAPEGVPPPAPGSSLRTLGYIGRLDAHKGVDSLLDAAPALTGHGVRVRVAGDGPLRDVVAASPAVDYVGRLAGGALARFLGSCRRGRGALGLG